MAVSEIQICNMALGQIGINNTITSLTGTSIESLKCNLYIESARTETMELFGWKFAKVRTTISADGTAPEFEYDYRYAVPADALMVISLYDDTEIYEPEWELEAGYMLTDEAGPITIVYLKDETNMGKYSPLFRRAVMFNLAGYLAMSLKGSEKLQQQMWAYRDQAVIEARRSQVHQGNKKKYPPKSSWQTTGRPAINDNLPEVLTDNG